VNPFERARKEVDSAARRRAVREVLRVNRDRFVKTPSWAKSIIVFGVCCMVFMTWYAYETRHIERSLTAECQRMCHPLAGQVEVRLLNPFLGESAYRNIRGHHCICGEAKLIAKPR
jgi:hypothetical protein